MSKHAENTFLPLSMMANNGARVSSFVGIGGKEEGKSNRGLYEKMEGRLGKQGKKENERMKAGERGCCINKNASQATTTKKHPIHPASTARTYKPSQSKPQPVVSSKPKLPSSRPSQDQPTDREKDKEIEINISIINALEEQTNQIDSTVPDVEDKAKIESVRLLKKYQSQNRLKKYHYLEPEPLRKISNKMDKSSENILYLNPNVIQASIQTDQMLNKYKEDIKSLNYHYHLNPDLPHRSNLHSTSTTRLRSRSGKSINSLTHVLGYPGDRERARKQRDRSITSVERVQRQEEVERQVYKLKQRCQNIMNSVGQCDLLRTHKYNYLEEMQRVERRSRQRSRELDLLRDKEREISLREKKLRQKEKELEMVNRVRLAENQRTMKSREREIRYHRERENQIRREREISQRSRQIDRRQIQIQRKQEIQKQKERERMMRQKQRQRQPMASYSSQPTPYITQFKLPEQPCSCQHSCSCSDPTTQLNTSRLHRINNKLQSYITKNIGAGLGMSKARPGPGLY